MVMVDGFMFGVCWCSVGPFPFVCFFVSKINAGHPLRLVRLAAYTLLSKWADGDFTDVALDLLLLPLGFVNQSVTLTIRYTVK
jgi:hypothetical protein